MHYHLFAGRVYSLMRYLIEGVILGSKYSLIFWLAMCPVSKHFNLKFPLPVYCKYLRGMLHAGVRLLR